MGLWFYSYFIINLVIFVYYCKKTNGVFQAPLLMAYTALFVLIPQFATIYNNPFYDKRLIPDLGIVMISCNIAFVVGFELAKKIFPKPINEVGILHLNKIKYILIIFSLIGFSVVFFWDGGKYQEGDNVIQVNLKQFSQMALCLVVTGLLTYRVKNRLAICIFILSIIPLLYFAFIVKGSRGETLFLLFVVAIYIAMRYPKKESLVKKCTFAFLLIGALFNTSIVWVRNVIINQSENSELSLIDNFINSFSQEQVKLGMDLGNAAIGIKYLNETNQLDFGTYLYDDFIQNVVPRRVVGESYKEGLKLKLVDDQDFIKRLTHGVTTMTGYYHAFRSFSYLGFILYLIIGLLYGLAYSRIRNSAVYLYLYLLILPTVPLIFTHGPGYLYMRIYVSFLAAYIFCRKGFQRYKILNNGKINNSNSNRCPPPLFDT